MTPINSTTNWRAISSVSAIMSLRMLGLFMVLPVLSIYLNTLPHATPKLIGLAVGVYGLTQAICQIPFGILSDRFGRKPLIAIGLIVFIAGSLIAAYAQSIETMIVGRSLQGIGAVGSTLLALLADLTPENQRTKAMAIAGVSIGGSFMLALLIGPLIIQWLNIGQLFNIAALFGFLGILVLYFFIPPTNQPIHASKFKLLDIYNLLTHPKLLTLNGGIFLLHAIFTASMVALPLNLVQIAQISSVDQWRIYLPTLIGGFILSLFAINHAERSGRWRWHFLSGIFILAGAEILLSLGSNYYLLILGISLFFFAFSLLEAFLPSLISRTAPPTQRGSALGLYSCAQFFGIFCGGVIGGWLYGYNLFATYLFCCALALIWLILAYART